MLSESFYYGNDSFLKAGESKKMFRNLPTSCGNMTGVIEGKEIKIIPNEMKAYSKILVENILITDFCTKFSAFYGTSHSTTVFTSAHIEVTRS